MAKTAIEEHVYIGSMRVGRGIPNVSLQQKVQAIISRPFNPIRSRSQAVKEQLSHLRVEHLWHVKENNISVRPIIKRKVTLH